MATHELDINEESPKEKRDKRIGRKRGNTKNWDFESDLRIVTVNLPQIDLDYIEEVIRARITPSRSEYVRTAVRNQINRDIEQLKFEDGVIKEEIKLDPKKFVRVPGYNGNKPVKIIRRLEY